MGPQVEWVRMISKLTVEQVGKSGSSYKTGTSSCMTPLTGELDFARRKQPREASEPGRVCVSHDPILELGGWTVSCYFFPEFMIAPGLHSGSMNHGHPGQQVQVVSD